MFRIEKPEVVILDRRRNGYICNLAVNPCNRGGVKMKCAIYTGVSTDNRI